jgi:predicted Zn-dependent peptidase
MIRQLDVDGVPTLLAQSAGPMQAGLTFRVGQADETLAHRGITHLLEHLLLHEVGMADYHYNGATGSTATHFHMQGSVEDITAFLTGVCRSINDLSMDRLETEKGILRTEWGSRVPPATEPMPLWRHGARDYGLVSFPEWGLAVVTADDLRAWAEQYFTRENAVLWIAGEDVPRGLALDLPSGHRRSVPAASSALPQTPAYFTGPSRATAMDAVVRRSVAATIYTGVLERELHRALRREGGLSYTAAAMYEPRGDGFSIVTALADALPEKQEAVLGGFIDVLAKLRAGRIDETDVTAVVGRATDVLLTADADAARLPGAACNLLTRYPIDSRDELVRMVKAVTAAEVHSVAVAAHESALLMAPVGRTADWAGFTAAPTGSTEVIDGVAYPAIAEPRDRILVGAAGVSTISADGAKATVRFDDCAAMLAWPDGGRQLIGNDAIAVRIEPTLLRRGGRIRIDDRVPAQVHVPMPPREPNEIPRPPRLGRFARLMPSRHLTVRQRTQLAVLGLITLLIGGLTLVMSVGMVLGLVDPRPLAAIGGWIISGYLGRSFLKNWQEMRR